MLKGPLVLQTFGAHWTAVAGAKRLDGIDDQNLPVGKPVGGLGLAAAAVSIVISCEYVLTCFFTLIGRTRSHLGLQGHYYHRDYQRSPRQVSHPSEISPEIQHQQGVGCRHRI